MAEYQNPQQEPGADRKLLLVFALTFLVIMISQPLLRKYAPQPPQPAKTQTQSVPAAAAPVAAVAAAPSAAAPSATAVQASAEAETVLENDLYRITFTNRGALVKSWVLKKFQNDKQTGPLDLVNAPAAEKYGYPLSLFTYDATLRDRINSALFVLDPGHSATGASFDYSDGDLVVHKTFHFDDSYVVRAEASVTYKGSPVAAFPAWPSGFGDQATPASYVAVTVAYQSGSDIVRPPARCGMLSFLSRCNPVSNGATVTGPFHWAGTSGQYFAAIFLPDDAATAALVTLRNPVPNPFDANHPFEVLGTAVGSLAGPSRGRIYVGPKDIATLQTVSIPGISSGEPSLSGLVDYGWFGIIAKPLFLWLKWIHNHIVGNWGWAIMLQTLVITLLLLPLRITQMKSMLRMQRVAPQIKAIQEKYKKYSMRDPRKAEMNTEVAELYKKEGVNPAGGCLPLLIQMPFLYAYYRMLSNAVELRQAPWLWIHDLSSPEMTALRFLPIFMVVSMLIMQRMTPQAGMDPAQQRMMTIMMPAMMGFIFWNLASGLNLYYTETNLIGIAQQMIMNRTELGREMRELAEKRARKKDK